MDYIKGLRVASYLYTKVNQTNRIRGFRLDIKGKRALGRGKWPIL